MAIDNYLASIRPRRGQGEENYLRLAMSAPSRPAPSPRERLYPVPPYTQEHVPFDQGIFRRPVAPGTRGLNFDNNGYTEDEWYRYVYPALIGRQRLDI